VANLDDELLGRGIYEESSEDSPSKCSVNSAQKKDGDETSAFEESFDSQASCNGNKM
jgi:hypothetical protein